MRTNNNKDLDKLILPKDGPTGGVVSQEAMDALKERQDAILAALYNEVRSTSSSSNSSSGAGDEVEEEEEEGGEEAVANQGDDANCGPASVTNVAAEFGKEKITSGNEQSEIAESRSEMGADPDPNTFTDTSQVARGIRANGLQAKEYEGNATTNDIDRELASGGKVVVNGSNEGWGGTAPKHFFTVVGKDSEGNYLVKDSQPQFGDRILRIPKSQMQAAMSGYMVAAHDTGKISNQTIA